MVDPLRALMLFLKDDSEVATLSSGRVYAGELPRADVGNMPRRAVVLSPAGGGLLGLEGQSWGDRRIDVDCYGSTPNDSWTLYLAVEEALEGLKRVIYGGCLLHWVKASSRGVTVRVPETDWPLTFASYQVMASKDLAA